MARIEFFFDVSSPWTYLAFHGIEPLARETGATLVWRPILVGGVFNAANPSVYLSRENPVPAKQAYQAKDIADWAALSGITIRWQPTVFPVNSVKAMRCCVVADMEGRLPEMARAFFQAYWGEDRDISQDDVITEVLTGAGFDAGDVAAKVTAQEVKDALRANTDELIRRGGFGSPTMFVDGDDMYFGYDRLQLIYAALRRKRHAAE